MKKSFVIENAISGIRSNLMSYALMLTSSRADACRLVDEVSQRTLNDDGNAQVAADELKGIMFSLMRDIYNANYRGLKDARVAVAGRETRTYSINVVESRGIASLKGVKTPEELVKGVAQLKPAARNVFTMYALGYTRREIRKALGMRRISVLSHIVASIAAIF